MKPADYRVAIAAAPVYDVAVRSPVEELPALSKRLGNAVLLKREDLQPVFSFKLRGAYNKMAGLGAAARARGVAAASAGNHAQGVALAARRLRTSALIVMPRTTPSIKVDAVRAHRARVVLHGDTYDQAAARARELGRDERRVFVPPYDDREVIVGQGTVGKEIDEQCGDGLDAVFVPVGGGGLLAGVVAWLRLARPNVRVFGVEPEDAASLRASLEAGRRVRLPEVGLFADGVAVDRIGRLPWQLLREPGTPPVQVVTVSNDEICAAIRDIFEATRTVAEPAGALALAGLKRRAAQHRWRRRQLLAIHSGANLNFDRLRYISERADFGTGAESLFCVGIPERPGSFLAFCRALGRRNVTEFNYRYAGPGTANIFVGVAKRSASDSAQAIMRSLRRGGYEVEDLSGDELAKLHLSHIVGGRSPPDLDAELLFSVEFPERPGSLLNFLTHLGDRWSISLFHYRNHGADYGRVLVGLQASAAERRSIGQRLDSTGFAWREETGNVACAKFLSPLPAAAASGSAAATE